MKHSLKFILYSFFVISAFSSCINSKKLVTDEVVLKDGNSQTGTIVHCDSTSIKIKKMDESMTIISWTTIDTIQGKKLKSFWLGMNVGFYNTPYFSVFRNEAITGRQMGMEYKAGLALRGNKLFYTHLTYSPASPYSITKFGMGYQKYIGKSTYLKKNSYFWGSEFNLMNAKYNNGSQTTFEPYTGFEKKLNDRLRIHAKLQLQFNLANKNEETGINFTVGIHFMKRNFRKYYEILNKEHTQSRN